MVTNITLKQLQALAAIAEHGSLTRASEALFLTQPAISSSLKQLENQIDMPLIEVINKRAELTNAGQLVYKSYLEIRDELELLAMNIEELKGSLSGQLRIAMVSTAKYFIPRLVGDFQKTHPKTETQLQILNRQDVIKTLLNNQCDFAVLSHIPPHTGLNVERIAENPLVMIASPEHELAKIKNINIKKLAEEKFIVREKSSGIRTALESLFNQHHFKLAVSMELSSTEAIKQLVLANIGISLVPKLSVAAELKTKKITALDVKGTPIIRHWHIVTLKNKRMMPVTKKFIEYLKHHIQQYI